MSAAPILRLSDKFSTEVSQGWRQSAPARKVRKRRKGMTAEKYLQEKERLSQALNGQDRLMEAVKDIGFGVKGGSTLGLELFQKEAG